MPLLFSLHPLSLSQLSLMAHLGRTLWASERANDKAQKKLRAAYEQTHKMKMEKKIITKFKQC